MLVGLWTEDADVPVVHLLQRPRVLLHVLQQEVKHTFSQAVKNRQNLRTAYHFQFILLSGFLTVCWSQVPSRCTLVERVKNKKKKDSSGSLIVTLMIWFLIFQVMLLIICLRFIFTFF